MECLRTSPRRTKNTFPRPPPNPKKNRQVATAGVQHSREPGAVGHFPDSTTVEKYKERSMLESRQSQAPACRIGFLPILSIAAAPATPPTIWQVRDARIRSDARKVLLSGKSISAKVPKGQTPERIYIAARYKKRRSGRSTFGGESCCSCVD